jgi:hypothetical protein
MKKDERIGLRVSSELKKVMVQVAKKEGRSLAQVCEIFLRGGISAYRKQGSKYIKRFVPQVERYEE